MSIDQPLYLMSPPRLDWALRGKANFRSETGGDVDAEKARNEWEGLADAIVAAGGEVVVCPPNPRKNLTGLIYTAEAGEFFRGDGGARRFMLPNMAAEHRRDEADWIGGFMEGLGLHTRGLNARWEAQGDVLRARRGTVVIHTYGTGKYARTEKAAYEEVAGAIGGLHMQIRFEADPWFHGNTFLNFYENVMLVCEEALAPGELERLQGFLPEMRVERITTEQSLGYDTNCLQVRNTIIGSDSMSPATEEVFRSLELEVVRLDLSELFSKGGGAPVCLTNRMWGASAESFPDHVRWSQLPVITLHTDL